MVEANTEGPKGWTPAVEQYPALQAMRESVAKAGDNLEPAFKNEDRALEMAREFGPTKACSI